MTCLELMKKLRPDLSEDYIINNFCPDTHELHMRKETPRFSFGCHSCVLSCYDCWNQEVDEEVLYFQDEKESKLLEEVIDELETENKAMRENFDSAMGLVSKRDREITELKDRVKELEQKNTMLDIRRENLKKEFNSCSVENIKLMQKNRELEKENKDLQDQLDENGRLIDDLIQDKQKLIKKNETLQEDLNYAMGKRNESIDDSIKLQHNVCDLRQKITELERKEAMFKRWLTKDRMYIHALRSVIKAIEATTGKEILGSIKSIDKEFMFNNEG